MPSERVAIGEAIEAEIKADADKRMKSGVENPPENFPELKKGDTRDLVAKATGFGNGKTYKQAKKVVQQAGHCTAENSAARLQGLDLRSPPLEHGRTGSPQSAPRLSFEP